MSGFFYISVCAYIDAEWITRTKYVDSDAYARVHDQGHVKSFLIFGDGIWYQKTHTGI